jgi:hypothetical protein
MPTQQRHGPHAHPPNGGHGRVNVAATAAWPFTEDEFREIDELTAT